MLLPAVLPPLSVGTMERIYRVCRKYSLRNVHTRHPTGMDICCHLRIGRWGGGAVEGGENWWELNIPMGDERYRSQYIKTLTKIKSST